MKRVFVLLFCLLCGHSFAHNGNDDMRLMPRVYCQDEASRYGPSWPERGYQTQTECLAHHNVHETFRLDRGLDAWDLEHGQRWRIKDPSEVIGDYVVWATAHRPWSPTQFNQGAYIDLVDPQCSYTQGRLQDAESTLDVGLLIEDPLTVLIVDKKCEVLVWIGDENDITVRPGTPSPKPSAIQHHRCPPEQRLDDSDGRYKGCRKDDPPWINTRALEVCGADWSGCQPAASPRLIPRLR